MVNAGVLSTYLSIVLDRTLNFEVILHQFLDFKCWMGEFLLTIAFGND